MAARSHRARWIGVAVLLCIIGVAGLAIRQLDPARLKPRLVEAVERATGRTLAISGKMGIKLALAPTITLEDVALSNQPGASRPDMMKAARVEVSFAVLPLLQHRIEVDRINLLRPDILLETDSAGHPNWIFSHTAAPVSGGRGPTEPAGRPFAISIKTISVEDGHVGWIDARSGQHLEGEIPRLAVATPLDGPVQVDGTIGYGGRSIGLTARTGAGRSSSETAATTWPVSLKLTSGDASLTADGQIARDPQGIGYKFTVDADLPDPGSFAAWFPRLPLAAVKSITARADLSDGTGPIPTLSAMAIKVRSIDLGAIAHESRLEDVTLTGSGEAPLKLTARVMTSNVDSGIAGTIGNLTWLNGGASGPVPVDLEWNAASARAHVKGTIQAPRSLSGVALDVAIDVPDPSLVTGDAPPALKSVSLRTRLTDAPGPIPFQVTSSAGDLAGELSISRNPRLSITGRVSSQHLDLDMLRGVAVPESHASGAVGPAPVEPAVPDKTAPLISDKKLTYGWIRAEDANLGFSLGAVRFGQTDVGSVTGTLSIKDGVLRLDPFSIVTPAQHQSAALMVDAAATPPVVHLTVDAPGVPLPPLLDLLELPQAATGTADIHADLIGTGDSPRALASSIDGWAGVAIEGGRLDAALINAWLERLRPLHVGGGNVTDLRCLAVRADAKSGMVTVQPAALNTSALIIEGSGEVDLGKETLALRLRPRTKIGETGIALPVRVSGKMRTPSAKVDISPTGFGGGKLSGLLLGGKDIMGAAGGGDPCPDALVRARENGPSMTIPAPVGKP